MMSKEIEEILDNYLAEWREFLLCSYEYIPSIGSRKSLEDLIKRGALADIEKVFQQRLDRFQKLVDVLQNPQSISTARFDARIAYLEIADQIEQILDGNSDNKWYENEKD